MHRGPFGPDYSIRAAVPNQDRERSVAIVRPVRLGTSAKIRDLIHRMSPAGAPRVDERVYRCDIISMITKEGRSNERSLPIDLVRDRRARPVGHYKPKSWS
jgi:hypothetical protein